MPASGTGDDSGTIARHCAPSNQGFARVADLSCLEVQIVTERATARKFDVFMLSDTMPPFVWEPRMATTR
jgi:hypothetical protein